MTDAAEKTNLVPIPTPKREVAQVVDPIPVLDTARFEHMQRIATVMARGSLIPDALRKIKVDSKDVWLSEPEVLANCFLVVNQAVRWGMDPFAVAQCVSVVHGRLCYEGKLVAAVLEAKVGVRLDYEWSGAGDQMSVTVTGRRPGDDAPRSISGTVAEWKTGGANSPWKPAQYRKMLAYRGAREWARLWAPGMMLGVYSDDEMMDLADNARAHRATPAQSLASRFTAPAEVALPSPQRSGFSQAHVDAETAHDPETGEVTEDAPAEAQKTSEEFPVAEPETAEEPAKEPSKQAAKAQNKPAGAKLEFPGADAVVGDLVDWCAKVLATATANNLDEVWATRVDVHKGEVFPADYEALLEVYDQRSRELNP